MFKKLLEIESNINKKNEGYFEVIMCNSDIERIIKTSNNITFLDIKENIVSLKTKNLNKLINKDIEYNFALDFSESIEEIKYYIIKEIYLEYKKELEL